MTTAERKRLEALEALHPGGKHPDYAAKVHTHTDPEPPPPPPPPPPPGPTYTFQDEFEGTTLDTSKWRHLYGPGDTSDRIETDCGGFGLTQVKVANSIATIVCEQKATPSGRKYASACMCTLGKFAQKYGTWEARVRYDEAPGTWPSWFLLPDGKYNPYPEIDIFESYGSPACLGPGLTENILHWTTGGQFASAPSGPSDYKIVPWSAGFHVVKLVWTATALRFYIDGTQTHAITDAAKIPQLPMYPIFIYGVGAGSGCVSTSATPSRLTMDIDYIRVQA